MDKFSQPARPGSDPSSQALTICAFESRKGGELCSLLERQGGEVTVAPSMREVPLEENSQVDAFADALFAGTVDIVILLTGVGTRALGDVVALKHHREKFLAELQKCTIIVRGPKPAAVLREWKVRIDHQVPEPNTWRELLALIDQKVPVAGKTVAVQEYGEPNRELYTALIERQAQVFAVPVYRWALPEDTGPLRAAIEETVAGKFDVLVITSAQQIRNVLEVAGEMGMRDRWLTAARECVVASIGPTATAALQDEGLPPDIEPEHPKMGHLAVAIARQARDSLDRKRSASGPPGR